MIDLHCHLLHGLDDGPQSVEQSLALCRALVADGVTHAITTPHIHRGRWDNGEENIAAACTALRGLLGEHNIPLKLGYAAEVRLGDDILQMVAQNSIPFYGALRGDNVMLLEFPHSHIIPGSEQLVKWLIERGIRPVIAHPERNRQIACDNSELKPFVDAGCWFQVTAASITGHFGRRAQETARVMLDADLVTFVASDAHNTTGRCPRMTQAWAVIEKQWGQQAAKQLCIDTPMEIAAGQFAEGQLNTECSAP